MSRSNSVARQRRATLIRRWGNRWGFLGINVILALLVIMSTSNPPNAQQQVQPSILNDVLQRGELRIATITGNPPYSSVGATGELEGYDIDIGKAIAEALGARATFMETSIPGRIALLQTRQADITIADFTKTVQRATTISFTDPYLVVGLQFLVLRSRDDLNTVADLNKPNIRIGISTGGTAEQIVPRAAPQAQIVGFAGPSAIADELLALRNGTVDAISQDNLFNAGQLAQNPDVFKAIPELVSREDISIGLPIGDFTWWLWLNQWVQQFNATGQNAELFRKWFGFELPRIQADF